MHACVHACVRACPAWCLPQACWHACRGGSRAERSHVKPRGEPRSGRQRHPRARSRLHPPLCSSPLKPHTAHIFSLSPLHRADAGKCLYISGIPGTGKTATVLEIMRSTKRRRWGRRVWAVERYMLLAGDGGKCGWGWGVWGGVCVWGGGGGGGEGEGGRGFSAALPSLPHCGSGRRADLVAARPLCCSAAPASTHLGLPNPPTLSLQASRRADAGIALNGVAVRTIQHSQPPLCIPLNV